MNLICKCDNNIKKKFNYTSYWENREVTTDEIDIYDFLKNKKYKFKNKKILHIGVGNSFFAKKLITSHCSILGITISYPELIVSKNVDKKKYNVFLINKFSEKFQSKKILNNFDLIIDPNLKTFACCEDGFLFFFNILIKKMKKNSILITSRKGMKCSIILKRKLSFSVRKFFYFKLKDVPGSKKNILRINECKKLSKAFSLNFFYNKNIAYFKKI